MRGISTQSDLPHIQSCKACQEWHPLRVLHDEQYLWYILLMSHRHASLCSRFPLLKPWRECKAPHAVVTHLHIYSRRSTGVLGC